MRTPWLILFALVAFRSTGSAQVSMLVCTTDANPASITANWTNPSTFDSIDVVLDGMNALSLPGDATTVTLDTLAAGPHELRVVPILAGVPTSATGCAVLVPELTATSSPTATIGQASDPTNPSPTLDPLTVTDTVVIQDVSVRVDIAHTFRGDLEVRIASPTGLELTLANNDGGSEPDLRATFYDGGLPYDGSLLGDRAWITAEGPGQLADFAGSSSAGEWVLSVEDTFASQDDGVLESWSLGFVGGGPGLPITDLQCNVSATELGRVELAWTNASPYDAIDLEIDGAIVATLDGDAVDFTTDPLQGTVTVCVRGVVAGVPVAPACCTITVAPPAVTDLNCAAIAGETEATISWSNAATYYETIEVAIAGATVATLSGDATAATVPVTPETSFTLCVTPIVSAVAAAPSCCRIDVPTDTTEAIVIVALETIDGMVDSATAWESAVAAAGIDVVTLTELNAALIGLPRAVIVTAGTFPENRPLVITEGTVLVDLILSGVPVLVEGGDVWGFDDPTPFATVDGVAADSEDGDDSFLGMQGHDFASAQFAGWDAPYTQDAGTDNDYTDRLSPALDDDLGPNSGVIWTDDGTGGSTVDYATGVFYDTPPGTGPVISQSWEFGGYDGDRDALALRYLEALGVITAPTFRRGDANADANVDISDVIFLLEALFIGGAFPPCADAADVNDDGALEVSDAVYLLSFLFAGGAPPPAPGVAACGPDETPDGLVCPDAC